MTERRRLVDTQCHIFPRAYAEFLRERGAGFSAREVDGKLCFEYDAGMRLMIDFNRYDMEPFLRNMDEQGVTLSVISCNIPDPGVLAPEDAAEACIIINDEIHRWVSSHPDRFAGIASIPWHAPDAAVRELRRVKALGFKGVQLLPHNGGKYVDDPVMEDSYAVCEELDLPIFIHPTAPTWHDATAAYAMTVSAAFPMDTSLACIRLVYGGVLERYPGLRFHQPHAGGVLPWLDGRLSYQPKGVMKPKLAGGLSVRDHIIGGRFWFDACNPSPFILRAFRDYVGTDRLMFATDYPFLGAKDMLAFMDEVGYTEEELEAICWKNADRFYRLGLAE